MPDFWEFPTVSMGLTALNSIYQARFNRYLHNRGIKDTSQQHVWAFLGDGEMGEPESLGAIGVAAREELDNLTWVINCNLQQLDGPVRGNGKIIQELESQLPRRRLERHQGGLGPRVGRPARPRRRRRPGQPDEHARPTAQFQTYSVEDGAYIREHFFGGDPRLRKMVEHMSDEQIEKLPRGGHDYRKVYAAFDAATKHVGQPTVILAQTIKGWTIDALEGKNATHQMKKLTPDDLKKFRDRLYLPISDRDLERRLRGDRHRAVLPPRRGLPRDRVHDGAPPAARRLAAASGVVRAKPLKLPGDEMYAELKQGSGKNTIATTMARRPAAHGLDEGPGDRPADRADRARTSTARSAWTRCSRAPRSTTRAASSTSRSTASCCCPTRSPTQGQMLHEGISEAGAMASATAAGSAYSTHGEHMIPFYIFYSMFGFQRTGDSIWAMADQLARGFLIGATAGRTTLTGEGLQHADGHSPLLAATNPAVVHYDPAFAYEVATSCRTACERMYGSTDEHPHGEDVIFYLTVYNEPVAQPAEPEDVDVEGILKGIHQRRRPPTGDDGPRVQLLASGVGFPWVAEAAADARRGVGRRGRHLVGDLVERAGPRRRRRRAVEPAAPRRAAAHGRTSPSKLTGADGPGRRGLATTCAPCRCRSPAGCPADYRVLGADGFGFADTRPGRAAVLPHRRRSRSSSQALQALADAGEIEREPGRRRRSRKYRIDDPTAVAGVKQEGGDA